MRSTLDGQSPSFEGALVVHQSLVVLEERPGHVPDAAHAEADHVGSVAHGVAHEVPPEGPVGDRLAHLVLGQGEVVHADGQVAGAAEGADRRREELDLHFGGRQRLGVDRPLVPLDVG